MESESIKSPETLAILVVGTDTVIEALPARPIQLANACGALGFDLVVPLSWGDELVAEAALRALKTRSPGPALLCVCPLVRDRLSKSGAGLASAMVSVQSPPVAVARHLRATISDRIGSVSFVGRCPGASAPEYDASYTPDEFFGILRARGIQMHRQPDVFQDRLPTDRSRHLSLPGGCPTPEALWQRCNEMTLAQVDSADFSVDIAQHLMSSKSLLVDPGPAIGCFCCGVTHGTTSSSARIAATSLDPPRSKTSPVSFKVVPDLMLPIQIASPVENGAEVHENTSKPSSRPPMAVTPPSALRVRNALARSDAG